jgi:hypothetical protein
MRESIPVVLDPNGDAWDVAARGLVQSGDMDEQRRLSPDALRRALRVRDACTVQHSAAPHLGAAPEAPPLAPFQRQSRPWAARQPGAPARSELRTSVSTPRLLEPSRSMAPSTPPSRAPAREAPAAPDRPRARPNLENCPLRANQDPSPPRPPFGERLLKHEVQSLETQVTSMDARLRAANGSVQRHQIYNATLERTVGLLSLAIRDKAATSARATRGEPGAAGRQPSGA